MTITGGNGGQPPQFEVELRALGQLKDFFGANFNEELGRQALRSARTATGYDIQVAVNWLLDQNNHASCGNQRSAGVAVSSSRGPQPPSNSATCASKAGNRPENVSDTASHAQKDGREKNVGGSDETELQKAIALSLVDQPQQGLQQQQQQQQTPLGLGGQISAEEQELSRVIEASIAESKKGAAMSHDLRQSSLFFVDPANPHERERQGVWPVGLKNVGNTCWFSVVAQALFHLPMFRWRLLRYDLDGALGQQHPVETAASSSASASASTLPRELEFAAELRKLYALLLASRRKYADPSAAVDVLRKQDSLQLRNIGGLDCGQQDVSEFTHLLLEWLEEAFKLSLPRADPVEPMLDTRDDNAAQMMDASEYPAVQSNPIEDLFYGTFVMESALSAAAPGADGNGTDVQVVPTIKEERFSQYPLQVLGCDTLHDSMEKSLRPEGHNHIENWLERLPPVLLFELTRFQYNQIDKKPEKIHSQFRFPKVLYVDRYLRENKVAIREKRVHVSHLRQRLKSLKDDLEKLDNYRGSEVPLTSILELTLDLVASRGGINLSCETDLMDGCEPIGAGDGPSEGATRQRHRLAPVSAAECAVMERCLGAWRAQFQALVDDLKAQIAHGEQQIESIYLEPEFQQHPYMLHAVLVHEGQASLGHYWAFIHDRKADKWMKFNDVQVTEVSYDEVERDSIGGYQSTSAYCLVYVDVRSDDLGEDSATDTQLIASLPPELQKYVVEDNRRFWSEVQEWDSKHAAATTPMAPTGAAAGPRPPGQDDIKDAELIALVEDHNRLFARRAHCYVQEHLNAFAADSLSPEDAFAKLIDEKMRITELEAEEFLRRIGFDGSAPPDWHACVDERVNKCLPFYAHCWMRCNIGKSQPSYNETLVLRRIILDYFANNAFVGQDATETMTSVYQMSKRALSTIADWTNAEQYIYARVCQDFKNYLETLVLLSYAVDLLDKGDYVRSLHGILCTKDYAERLSTASENAGGIDYDLVLTCYRAVIMHLSGQTIKEIVATNDDHEAAAKVQAMRTHLLPSLAELWYAFKDSETLETVRAGWFAALLEEENDLSEAKKRELRDFLDALIELETVKPDSTGRQAMNAKIKLQSDITGRFRTAIRQCRDLSILQCTHVFPLQ